MMASSNGRRFRVTGLLWRKFTGHRWTPLTKASNAELGFFFDLRMNKGLCKHWWLRQFEIPSRSLWRPRDDFLIYLAVYDPYFLYNWWWAGSPETNVTGIKYADVISIFFFHSNIDSDSVSWLSSVLRHINLSNIQLTYQIR